MRHVLPRYFVLLLIPTLVVGFFVPPPTRAVVGHVVIREVQVGGATAADEFIELYNPSGAAVNLEGWRLSKRTASGNQTNLLTTFPAIALNPSQHFLVTHPTGYTTSVVADATYSTQESLAANNTVVLFSDAGQTVVDLVGFGTASSFEGAAAPNPPSAQSLERLLSGSEVIDTDSNATDFALTTTPTPTNIANSSTPPPPPTPTPSPPETPPPSPSQSNPPSGGGTGVVQALPGDILVNEFVPDPGDGENEWVELINRTGYGFNLTGWVMSDGAEHQTLLTGTIAGTAPMNFFVIEKPKGNLNNSGDHLVLKNQNGQIIDQVVYGDWADGNLADNAPTAKDPESVARTVDGLTSGNAALDFALTRTPTRGLPNIITTTATTTPTGPATLRLSELLPNPVGSDAEEFIEVVNIGAVEVNAVGWHLMDASGGSHTIEADDLLNPVISPGAFLALPRRGTSLALNNTGGETVRLFPPGSESPVHVVSYTGTAPEGASWASFSDAWRWTTTPTSGTANVLTVANRPPVASLNAARVGTAGVAVSFSAEDSTDPDGDALTFRWSFGDEGTGSGEVAEHVYAKAGRYDVSLTVMDSRGETATAEAAISVADSATATAFGEEGGGTAGSVLLNEFFPAPPKGEEEWIELWNPSEQTVSLSGWSLQDASGRRFTLTDSLTIAPHDYLVLRKSTTRLALNNTGDTVALHDSADALIDTVTYPKAPSGASFARDENDEWGWTTSPTPSSANAFTGEEGTTAASSTATAVRRGPLTVTGTVVALPGTIGERVLYLNGLEIPDAPANLRVDLPRGLQTTVTLMDRVEVTGSLRHVQGEPRLRVSEAASLRVVGQTTAVAPTPFEDVDPEANLGLLVMAAGVAEEKTRGGFVLSLESGDTIRVIVPPGLGSRFTYPLGTAVTVTGVLSKTSAGLRVLLRTADDLVMASPPLVEEPAPAAAAAASLASWPYLLVTTLGALGLLAVVLYRLLQSRPTLATAEVIDDEETV